MNNERIEIGDIVCVNFNQAQTTLCHRAVVLYIPCAAGDDWIFKDAASGQIHYVSEFCTVSLMEKGSEDE